MNAIVELNDGLGAVFAGGAFPFGLFSGAIGAVALGFFALWKSEPRRLRMNAIVELNDGLGAGLHQCYFLDVFALIQTFPPPTWRITF